MNSEPAGIGRGRGERVGFQHDVPYKPTDLIQPEVLTYVLTIAANAFARVSTSGNETSAAQLAQHLIYVIAVYRQRRYDIRKALNIRL